jgi:hypothetical protein
MANILIIYAVLASLMISKLTDALTSNPNISAQNFEYENDIIPQKSDSDKGEHLHIQTNIFISLMKNST